MGKVRMKRIRFAGAVALTLALLLALSPVAAAAAEEEIDYGAILEDILGMFEIDPSEESGARYEGDWSVAGDLGDEWLNVLLLGCDNRTLTRNGRTDSMIVLSYNASAQRARLTSIMRDTWVHIEGHGDNKINAANVYGGPELAMRTVNECFGLNIERYVLINMIGLAQVIDQLGGVDVDIEQAELKYVNYFLGEYAKFLSALPEEERVAAERPTPLEDYGDGTRMTGAQAMSFARIRNLGDDYRRVERQQAVLLSMARRFQEIGASAMPDAIRVFAECVETNFTTAEFLNLAFDAIRFDLSDGGGIDRYRVPEDGTYESGNYDGVWSIRPDFDRNRGLIRAFIYGE